MTDKPEERDDFVRPDIEHMTTAQMLTGTATPLYRIHDYTDADKARAAAQRGRGAFSYAARPVTASQFASGRLPIQHQERLGPDFQSLCDNVVEELRREGKWETARGMMNDE